MPRLDIDVAMEIASHEAVIRHAYKDAAGVWTWSVGLTSATGHDVTRYVDRPASLRRCLELYVWALGNYARQVELAFAGHALSKAQFAAALSFHWNTGAIARARWVELWKQGETRAARRAFMAWRRPKAVLGRRRKERDLFFDGTWSNDGTMIEFTRLRRDHTPDWSSGRRIAVRQELQAALRLAVPPVPDRPPRPAARPAAPTLSPEKQGSAGPAGKRARIAAMAPLLLAAVALGLAVAFWLAAAGTG